MSSQVLDIYKTLNHLIRIKATGSPQALSRKLNISERSLYSYLAVLKENGAPIKYNRHRETYYYDEEGSFEFVFKPTSKEYHTEV